MFDKLTVTTVCKIQHNQSRPTYSKMWVDRLYKGVKRNLDIPFEFVCFSNDIKSDDYRTEPLITNSWGWWNKLEQFRKDLLSGPVLYLDLDIVVCRNLTIGLQMLPTNKILMVREPYHLSPGIPIKNSSIIFWEGDYGFLFDEYRNNQEKICNDYRNSGVQKYGDQGYIENMTPTGFIDDYLPEDYVAWKHHVTGEHNIDQDPALLIFTSKEKPINNLNMPLVQKNWID